MPSPIVPISRIITLTAYFLLFFFLIIAIVTKKIYPEHPELALIVGLLTPMLFPLRGILRAVRYTHAWASFLFLFYIVIGTDVWASGNPAFGSVVLLLTIALFSGCVLYARYSPLPFHGVENQSIKPNSED